MKFNSVGIAYYVATGLLLNQPEEQVENDALEMCEESDLGIGVYDLVHDFAEQMLYLVKDHVCTIEELFIQSVNIAQTSKLREVLMNVTEEYKEDMALCIEGARDNPDDNKEEIAEVENQIALADIIFENTKLCDHADGEVDLYLRGKQAGMLFV